jgi:hypothetical protein
MREDGTMRQTCAGRILLICVCLVLAACGGSDEPGATASASKVGGRVSGLAGTGLVLQLNGGSSLAVSRNGTFEFGTELASGATYSVTATAQPTAPSQTCSVTGGSGMVDSGDVDFVTVTCQTNSYNIGGNVSGLSGTLVLQNRGGDDVTVSANVPFTFATKVLSGDAYGVTIKTQTTTQLQDCVVTNGGGRVAGANVGNVAVACTNVPLALVSSNPPAAATNVLRTFSPKVYFSTTLNPATVTAGNISLTGSGITAATVLTQDSNAVTIAPTRLLLPQTTYTLTAGIGLRGSQQEQLAAPVSTTFTTRDGSWQGSQAIENSTGGLSYDPRIACSADGTAVAVWSQVTGSVDSAWSNRYVPGVGWGIPTLLENTDSDVGAVRVAMDANGNAIAVWQQYDDGYSSPSSIWASRFTPAAGWTAPVRIENSNLDSYDPSIAMDGAGNAVVAWELNGVIWSNRYTFASNSWGTAGSIQSVAQSSDGVVVAMNASGTAFAVWTQYDGTSSYRTWGNRYVPGSGWGTAVQLQSSSLYSYGADVAVDAGGNAIATWNQDNGNGNANIWVNRYVAGTGWSGASVIQSGTLDSFYARVAMNSTGRAVVVWSQFDGITYRVWANRYVPGTGWAGPTQLQSVSEYGYGPAVAMDETGNAIAIWSQYNNSLSYQTWSARLTPGTGWAAAAVIQTVNGASSGHAIATDASGSALAVWRQPAGTAYDLLWSRRFE